MVKNISHKKALNRRSVLIAVAWILWAVFSFVTGWFIVGALYEWLAPLMPSLQSMNESALQAALTALSWAVTLAIAIGGPYVALKQRVTRDDIGLQRLPTWGEIGLAAAGYVASTILAAIIIFIIASIIPGFNAEEAQDVGFSNLVFRYEFIIAFVTLVVIAPIVEEIFFRGYLYSRLKKYLPTWMAIIIVSALFGVAHGQINVGIMTFVMSIFLCLLRDLTGSLWPAITMHMIRNGIAFIVLFVVPILYLH